MMGCDAQNVRSARELWRAVSDCNKKNKVGLTHGGEFNGNKRITWGWESEVKTPRIDPLDMFTWKFGVPQFVDEVGTDVVRMDAEVARFVRFDSPGEKGEMFKYISEGRDEVEDGLLYRMLRLGDRWEEVVDRSPDEGDDEVQSMDFYWVWAGKTEPGGGSHSDCSDSWLRHDVVRGGRGEEGRESGGMGSHPIFFL